MVLTMRGQVYFTRIIAPIPERLSQFMMTNLGSCPRPQVRGADHEETGQRQHHQQRQHRRDNARQEREIAGGKRRFDAKGDLWEPAVQLLSPLIC